ncbi:hypothetical protein [Cohnella cholangitidis]|uniref:Uncharacterized protein n=1 Tax=Cohnella cholangitidis TaxID=2598458 RepID=A0A7G5C4D5_9BACL|nr:hypothetical protein [Cohnella cholangitidis]QMV44069.1 hypothetical protein FPL14_25050 [Cohnella cholangitidis]
MRKYKKWVYTAQGLLIASIVLIVAFNYVVDPYQIYRTPTATGFNLKKLSNQEYLWKARLIADNKPDVIFLGSSRTSRGLDPEYYTQITGDQAFNIGLSGANVYVELRYLEYALLNNKSLKTVYVGLDFEGFNKYSETTMLDGKRLESVSYIKNDLLSTLFTKQSLLDSIRVLKMNRSIIPPNVDEFLSNGSNSEVGLVTRNQQLLERQQNRFFDHLKDHLDSKQIYANYELSHQHLDAFRKIVSLCSENNVDLHVFIQPSHALQWEGIQTSGLWGEFEEWKREVVTITEVWDFSGYNSITTSPPDRFDTYLDQSHYRKHIGNYVFNRTLHINEESVPDDFGFLLTRDNIEEQLTRIRNERDKWEKANPDIVMKVEELKASSPLP